jgi:hypothetical protein
MHQVEKWKWRIRWAGRSTTTRVAFTEAEIRREHPEAVKVEGSRVLVNLPDNDTEVRAFQRKPSPRS